MKTIKILLATDPNVEKGAITHRLTEYLKNLRKTRQAKEPIGDDDHSADLGGNGFEKVACELSDDVLLTWDDKRRIKSRVQCVLQHRTEVSGLGHLSEKEIQRLRPLMNEVRLVEPRDEHWVDETVSALHEEMPWMSAATNEVWHALRRCASAKDRIQLPILLLNGPPGIGKSVWARRLSELLEIPRCEIDASLGELASVLWGRKGAGRQRNRVGRLKPSSNTALGILLSSLMKSAKRNQVLQTVGPTTHFRIHY